MTIKDLTCTSAFLEPFELRSETFMATTRLLGASRRPLSSSSLRSNSTNNNPRSPSTTTAVPRCVSKSGAIGDKSVSGDGERRSTVVLKAASVAAPENVVTSVDPETKGDVSLASLLETTAAAVLKVVSQALTIKPPKLQLQMFLERMILNCRFFTLFAVTGSLIGSVLCFIEGCFTILEAYFQYFHSLSPSSDQAHVMKLLIGAIDMFLFGTVMVVFGAGLHLMFVGSQRMQGKSIPRWVKMQSVSEAKSRIGHAIMMILQVGLVEKFQTISLSTGLDLACAAASIFLSSASVFLLSRLFFERDAPGPSK